MVDTIKMVFELFKLRITLFITLSTATGFFLAKEKISVEVLIPILGIFFLACGSAALNQYQERHQDALMERTKNRPIPSGRIDSKTTLIFSLLLILFGITILLFGINPMATSLGILTVVWYNGVYTYLKRVSPLAVIPGSLIGALPPLVGWASTGKSIFSYQPMAIGLFFYIWQIPHFWLLLLNFGKEYEKAGYPSLTALLTKKQLRQLTFGMIMVTAILLLFLPLFGLGRSSIIMILLIIISASLIVNSLNLLRPMDRDFSFKPAFQNINIFIIAVMFLLTLDRLMY